MKTNVTLRVDKNLLEKYKDRINFSKFFEFCLRTIEGEEFYIDLKTGKEVYKENDLNPSGDEVKDKKPSSMGDGEDYDAEAHEGCYP